MADSESSKAPDPSPTNAPPKSKLDSLSRDDLIRFAKKQVEHTKECKKMADQLKENLSNKEKEITNIISQVDSLTNENKLLNRRIEELTCKMDFLNASVSENTNECTANELILKNRIIELENDLANAVKQISNYEEQQTRMLNDLETTNTLNSELRSQIEDAKAETVALREKRTVANVFSLEIKDYEKKVGTLNKELKDALAHSASLQNELLSLKDQHSQAKFVEEQVSQERDELKSEIMILNKNLTDERLISGELKEKLIKLQERLNSLEQDRGSERVELSKELAYSQARISQLEEAVEALREENKRLRTDRTSAEKRLEDLTKDYENFKSRARFVLEQKVKQEIQEPHTDEIERLEYIIKEQNETIEQLKENRSTLQHDISRIREQLSVLEVENRNYRRESEDASISLASTMDDLRSAKSELEKNLIEKSQLSAHVQNLNSQLDSIRAINEKLDVVIFEERNKFKGRTEQLEKQIGEEKKMREEAMKQLDENRKEQRPSRPAPVAAVFPQFSEREYSVEPRVHPTVTSKLSNETISEDCQIQEASLEDVLFGDNLLLDNVDGQQAFNEEYPANIEQLIEELENLRKHALHTRELLSESEAANGRLIEQSRFLKEEIRRLERNDERKDHIENMEYLKNVIIKFLTPERVTAEKCQLIPILNTMLRLSNDEVDILKRSAENDNQSAGQTSSWGSYIRWGGFS